MSNEQHTKLAISFEGKERVAIVTNLGWADKLHMELDMTSMEQALESAIEFVKSIETAPAFNDACNEGYVDEAREILSNIIEELESKDPSGSKVQILVPAPMEISIEITESYLVTFGE